MITIYPVKHFR